MNAPAAILALVLVETVVGGLVLTFVGPTWGKVRHGYEILQSSLLALFAWGAWASLRRPLSSVDMADADAAIWVSRLVALTAVLAAVAAIVLIAKLSPVAARILGIGAAVAGLASFVPLAMLRASRDGAGGVTQGLVELLLGAFLLGAIWVGMILGHWYLVEKRLSNKYMIWISWANVVAVGAGVAAVALSARSPVPCSALAFGSAEAEACAFAFSPLLAVGPMTLLIGFGVLAVIAVIAYFNVRLAKEGGRSIQASTGMFYLAVIMAPAAEFAAKIRFF